MAITNDTFDAYFSYQPAHAQHYTASKLNQAWYYSNTYQTPPYPQTHEKKRPINPHESAQEQYQPNPKHETHPKPA
jgi:hypothetical protein